MITIKVKSDARSVKNYFKEHLNDGEYYSEKGKYDGIWHGQTLEHLGIKEGSRVEAKDFDLLADGLNPKTGKKLTARQKENRRSCYDMVFSAPKSVSILAILAKDERLIKAHHEALENAFFEVEKRAQARVRKGQSVNARDNRITKNLVSCRFTHLSSRALDPQLHTHCVVFNATYDPIEKKIKALEKEEIYRSSNFITAVYRNDLAKKVKALGYEIEQSRHGWRIKNLPKEIETLFSKRSDQIKTIKEDFESRSGATLDNNALSQIAHITRKDKNHDLSEEDLLKLQQDQLTPHQKSMMDLVKETALASQEKKATSQFEMQTDIYQDLRSPTEIKATKEAIHYAIDHVFARKSVVRKEDLLEVALQKSAGSTSLESLLEELKSDQFIKIGQSIMTREEEDRENEILKIIDQDGNTGQFLGNSAGLQKPLEQKYEQQYLAAKQLLDSQSQFLYLRGKAGAGKTYTLKQIVQNLSIPVVLAAPTSSATDTLRHEVSDQSITVQKLLINETEQENLKNSLLIVDEAGLLSTREMQKLLQLAQKQNAKILFVGDTKQHNSVAAGDALRLIENHSPIPIAEISTTTRQKEARYLEAVQALSQGETSKGLKILEKMGALKSATENGSPLTHEVRAQAVAQEYLSKIQEGLTTLVVTPTWAEHERVTQAIRNELKQSGTISKEEVKLKTYQSLNFTQVEKEYASNLEQGHFLSFHAKQGKFKQGEIWEITREEKGQIVIRNTDKDSQEAYSRIVMLGPGSEPQEINSGTLMLQQQESGTIGAFFQKTDGQIQKMTIESVDASKILESFSRTKELTDSEQIKQLSSMCGLPLQEERMIHPKKYAKSFDVVKGEEKAFSEGDLILLKANYTSSTKNKLPNGTIRKIERIESDGTLHLEMGVKLDSKFRHFLHGYATTSQGSQGKTKDHVIISADSAAAGALSKNQLYVSVSRGTRGVTLFTEDLKKFKQAVEKSSDRTLVTEIKSSQRQEKQLKSKQFQNEQLKEIFGPKLGQKGYTLTQPKQKTPTQIQTQKVTQAMEQEFQKRRIRQMQPKARDRQK